MTKFILLSVSICNHLGKNISCSLVAASFLLSLFQLLFHGRYSGCLLGDFLANHLFFGVLANDVSLFTPSFCSSLKKKRRISFGSYDEKTNIINKSRMNTLIYLYLLDTFVACSKQRAISGSRLIALFESSTSFEFLNSILSLTH